MEESQSWQGVALIQQKESIDFVHHAYKSEQKGTLLVTLYYNKPTQRGFI